MTTKDPKVTLISFTQDPIRTLTVCWEQSRQTDAVDITRTDEELFRTILANKIPVAEMVDFVFLIENMSIALREQMVRHRVGHRFGPNVGVDIIPEISGSSFWVQSMRYLDMSSFFVNGEYHMPEFIASDDKATALYRQSIVYAQETYKDLIAMGVPAEEARFVIPLAAQHRGVWKMNLAALMHVMNQRSCWIAQLGVWKPIIFQIISELVEKVHPAFSALAQPPCINKEGAFHECPFKHFNAERIEGTDPLPPCPLFLIHHAPEAYQASKGGDKMWTYGYDGESEGWQCKEESRVNRYRKMAAQYGQLWGRKIKNVLLH